MTFKNSDGVANRNQKKCGESETPYHIKEGMGVLYKN